MRAKKHLGQHFLKDKNAVDKILDALEAQPGERFLEIGPGPATLTRPFNDRGFGLTVVEYDADMVAFLQEQPWDPPVEIVHGDFMDVDLEQLLPETTKVFSNLPYNVSVPITARLLRMAERIPTMVFMYQKEVAERIRAQPGCRDYGPISVLVRLYYDIDWHMNVKPGAFHPPPKVMSQVIRLRRLPEPLLPLEDLPHIEKLLRHLFGQRRKMVGSLLKKWPGGWSGRDTLLESLQACGLDPKLRPEQLAVSDYVRWYLMAKGEV